MYDVCFSPVALELNVTQNHIQLLESTIRAAGQQVPYEVAVIQQALSLIPYALIALEELRALASTDFFPERFGLSPGAPSVAMNGPRSLLSLCKVP